MKIVGYSMYVCMYVYNKPGYLLFQNQRNLFDETLCNTKKNEKNKYKIQDTLSKHNSNNKKTKRNELNFAIMLKNMQ